MSIDVVDDRLPAIFLVDLISVANGVDDGQAKAHVTLSELIRVRLQWKNGYDESRSIRGEGSRLHSPETKENKP